MLFSMKNDDWLVKVLNVMMILFCIALQQFHFYKFHLLEQCSCCHCTSHFVTILSHKSNVLRFHIACHRLKTTFLMHVKIHTEREKKLCTGDRKSNARLTVSLKTIKTHIARLLVSTITIISGKMIKENHAIPLHFTFV